MLREAVRCKREKKRIDNGGVVFCGLDSDFFQRRVLELYFVWRGLFRGLASRNDYMRFSCVAGFKGSFHDSELVYIRPGEGGLL